MPLCRKLLATFPTTQLAGEGDRALLARAALAAGFTCGMHAELAILFCYCVDLYLQCTCVGNTLFFQPCVPAGAPAVGRL